MHACMHACMHLDVHVNTRAHASRETRHAWLHIQELLERDLLMVYMYSWQCLQTCTKVYLHVLYGDYMQTVDVCKYVCMHESAMHVFTYMCKWLDESPLRESAPAHTCCPSPSQCHRGMFARQQDSEAPHPASMYTSVNVHARRSKRHSGSLTSDALFVDKFINKPSTWGKLSSRSAIKSENRMSETCKKTCAKNKVTQGKTWCFFGRKV